VLWPISLEGSRKNANARRALLEGCTEGGVDNGNESPLLPEVARDLGGGVETGIVSPLLPELREDACGLGPSRIERDGGAKGGGEVPAFGWMGALEALVGDPWTLLRGGVGRGPPGMAQAPPFILLPLAADAPPEAALTTELTDDPPKVPALDPEP